MVIVGSEIWMLVFFQILYMAVTMSNVFICKTYIFAVERAKSAGKFFFILKHN